MIKNTQENLHPWDFLRTKKNTCYALKGIGPTVIARLEQIGLSAFKELAPQDPASITKQISQIMGSSCWHNSSQAKHAIQAVITLAKTSSVN